MKVARDVVESSNESAKWGTWVHKQIENRLRDNTPLPVTISGYERLVGPIAAAPGKKLVECEWAVDDNLQACDWRAPNVWCRAIVDAGVVARQTALLWDWKTGKRKPSSDQLALSSALALANLPEVYKTRTAFVWLKEDKTDQDEFTRDKLGNIWQTFFPRLERMERAFQREEFPAKPSGLCRKHCPVPPRLCPHSGT
jgi:hypothetical protein